MAYYNPKPITFNPNNATIQGAGAIGNAMKEVADNLYKKQLQAREEQRIAEQFGYLKQRDNIKDEQWKTTNKQQQEQNLITNAYKDTEMGLKADKFMSDKTTAENEAKKLAIEEANKKQMDIYNGLYKVRQDPEFGQQVGAVKTTTEFGKPQTQIQDNPVLASLFAKPAMSPVNDTNFLQNGMSVPTFENKTSYDYDVLANLGASDVPIKTDSKSTSEYITLMDQLKTETNPERIDFIKKRITKLSESDMNSKQIDYQNNEALKASFSAKVGLNNQWQLATVDTREWSNELRAEANSIANKIINAERTKNPLIEKSIGEINAQYEQMNFAFQSLAEVGDIRFVDETVKSVFSNYLGLSEKEMQSTETTQALQSVFNIKGKVDSGATITDNEMQRQMLESFSNYQHKDKIKLGLKNLARRQLANLRGLKASLGNVAFNLKYGAIERNYETLYNVIDKETDTNQDTWKSVVNKGGNTTITVDDAQNYGITFE